MHFIFNYSIRFVTFYMHHEIFIAILWDVELKIIKKSPSKI